MSTALRAGEAIQKYKKAKISGFSQHGEGMCHGMCLDWIRRILKAQKLGRDKVSDYCKSDLSSPRSDILEAEKRDKKRREKIGQLQTMVAERMSFDLEEESAAAVQEGTYAAFRLDFFKAFMDHEKSLYKKRTGAFTFNEIRGSVSPNPYEFMPDDPGEDGPFIDWVKVGKYIRHTTGGNCYLVLMTSDEGKDHAVAVYKELAGDYRLMEPNHGEFVFDADGLLACLRLLCDNEYTVRYLGINELALK